MSPGMNYCPDCGARLWQMKGVDELTCRRGHHWPMPDGWQFTPHPREPRIVQLSQELKCFIGSFPGPIV